jgi:hypothetical protein
MATLFILVFLVLFLLSYFVSSLLVDFERLENEHDYTVRYYDTREYNRGVSNAPDEAKRILQRLDEAAYSAEGNDDELTLPQPIDTSEATPPNFLEGLGGASTPTPPLAQGGMPLGENEGVPETGEIPPALLPATGGEDQGQGPLNGESPLGPEEKAWAQLHGLLTKPPEPPSLDVDDFRLSPDGTFTYYLKQAQGPGTRLKGRAITVFALSDGKGKVKLASFPKVDLNNPSQGWDLGGKFNIISSKVYKGQIEVPPGGKILSVEVLAWDEDSKQLVFDKKIDLGGE